MFFTTFRTAIIFALAIAVVNGFGRFAYALLLPVMRQDLGWDYALSGWLNTANSLGYGAGALLGMLLGSRFRPAQLFVWGLVITVVTLLAGGASSHLFLMMFLRFACGVGSAWVFACGGALIASQYVNKPGDSAAAIGVYYAGGGLGIALSGLIIYPVLTQSLNWVWGWAMLGAVGIALSILPSKIAQQIGGATSTLSREAVPYGKMKMLTIAYFCFGAGYIVYLTFVVAWLKELRFSVEASVAIWLWLGLATALSGFIWKGAMAKWKNIHTFAAASTCTALGTALPLLNNSVPSLLISAALVGGSFFMVPGSVMAFARSNLPTAQWAKAMNFFTLAFALGQAVGPIVAGEIADAYSLNAAMIFGAASLMLGAALAQLQKRID